MTDRRRVLEAMMLTGGYLAAPALAQSTSRPKIEVVVGEEIGTISPDLYGYLLENIGTAIYDGVWVGVNSKIPHLGGIRKELVDRLRDIKASVIRWPGGNFADYYDWKDGVGPRARRPRRTNLWTDFMDKEAPAGPQRFDPNAFGTPEFMRLCQLTGGRPFLSVNMRSLTVEDFNRWVEYCNSPKGSTTLAQLRAADGSPEPHGVLYWGMGNEVWAAGGDMSAQEYAGIYKRFTANVPGYGADLRLIACGNPAPSIENTWTRDFLQACKSAYSPVPISAMSLHYYATNPFEEMPPGMTIEAFSKLSNSLGKPMADPLTFSQAEWYDILARTMKMDDRIESCWAAIGAYDPERTIKLACDEWGIFGAKGTELSKLNMSGRAVTLRDAIAAALTLDIFHKQADKLLVANFTGLINQEGGLFRAEGDKFVATPIYYVFQLYAAHQDGRSVRTRFEVPKLGVLPSGKSLALPALAGSASVRHRRLTLTVVNPHISEACEAEIRIKDAELDGAEVVTLTASDIHAQNTFERPTEVVPRAGKLDRGGHYGYRFPPASITRFTLPLKAQ